MSYSTLLAFPEKGPFWDLAEFSNAYGSHAYVWTALSEKYFNNSIFWMTNRGGMEVIYDKCKLPCERSVLSATYDAALVPRRDWNRFADDLDTFVALYPSDRPESSNLFGSRPLGHKTQRVCHLPDYAKILRWLSAHGTSPRPSGGGVRWSGEITRSIGEIIAIGFIGTSVASDLWMVQEKPSTEEDSELRRFDLSRDRKTCLGASPFSTYLFAEGKDEESFEEFRKAPP